MRQLTLLTNALRFLLLCSLVSHSGHIHANSQIRAHVKATDGTALPDAVVIAVAKQGTPELAANLSRTVDQIDREFVSYVNPVQVGTAVQFPNKDQIRHHVYSFSPAKRFELPLYQGLPAEPVIFDKPGIVVLGCNIHDWMVSYIYVSESPYFGRTDTNGITLLEGLSSGRYAVRVWHPRMVEPETSTVHELELTDKLEHTTEWTLNLKPDYRLRRAPLPDNQGY